MLGFRSPGIGTGLFCPGEERWGRARQGSGRERGFRSVRGAAPAANNPLRTLRQWLRARSGRPPPLARCPALTRGGEHSRVAVSLPVQT